MAVVGLGGEGAFPFALFAVFDVDAVVHPVDILLTLVGLGGLAEYDGCITGVAQVLIDQLLGVCGHRAARRKLG